MKNLLIAAALLLPIPAHAYDATMQMQARLVQCGSMSDMEQSCRENERCCAFLEPMAGDEVLDLEKTQCEWIVVEWKNGAEYHPSCVRVYE